MSNETNTEQTILERSATLFQESQDSIHRRADRLFAKLMVAQWLAGIAAALWISPKTWIGAASQTHLHVWAAIFLGGAIAGFPVLLAWKQPGRTLTRHTIAVAQMLTSALLVHLTGGRVETHFHVFGSLAFLAFYRDWRVLLTATVVVAGDHMARGLFWPQSVFGVLTASPWRWLEHAGWVLFEDTFLFISIRQGMREMFEVATRRAKLEGINAEIERQVVERTAEFIATHRGLQASEQKFRTLSASAPIGVFLTDAAGLALYTNPHWLHIAGLSLEESLGEGWQQAVHPDDAAAVFADWKSIASEGGEFNREFRFRTKAGDVRWVHVQSAAIRSETGEVTGHVGTVEDITKRKQADAFLNSVLQNLPITIFIKEAKELRFLMWNKGGEELTGYHNTEMVGKNDYDFFPKEQADYFVAKDRETLAGGKLVDIGEEEMLTRHRGTRIVHTRKIPIFDEAGRPLYLLGIAEDITERKRSEAELEKAQKQLIEISRMAGMAEVATGVLHNVGNVLNSVNVSSALVAQNLKKSRAVNLSKVVAMLRAHEADLGAFITNDPKGKQLPAYLAELAGHIANEQAASLRELAQLQKNIDHIKDIVAMQQGFAKVSGVTETVQVSELVEDALRMNASSLTRHDIHIIKEFGDVPAITTEKQKVLQILINLVSNAKHACRDANGQQHKLTIRVRHANERVCIAVSDNGVGIPPENLTRIFSHGFTTKKDGHGFGLHSGALAAKELGGSLSAHSEGPGCGATFTIELPIERTEVSHGDGGSQPSPSIPAAELFCDQQIPRSSNGFAHVEVTEPKTSVLCRDFANPSAN